MRFPPVDGASFHVLLQGSCWLLPPEGEAIPLSVGDVLLVPRGSSYSVADAPAAPTTFDVRAEDLRAIAPLGRYENGGSGPVTDLLCGAYLFDRSRPHPLLRDLPDLVHLPSRLGRHPDLRAAVDLLGAEITTPRPGADALVPALLDTLLLYILRAWLDDHDGTGWPSALRDPSVAAALQAIHADPSRAWTVEELGRRGGLSRSAFSRRFTALVGQPPLTYLTWWRMTLAARLLREQDLPLATIAKQVGYTSEYAFATAFKREYGTAPGRYRSRA
jgi:AraC-like DNA-binding protein